MAVAVASTTWATDIVARIDAVLPQTQCRQCGFDGCRPYAAAIADGLADIDRCPPGGDAGLARIAAVVGREPIPLDRSRGTTKPLALAVIDESLCIGCTLCIQACPVDAIVGGAKRMHDVVAALCTGCELCLPPCPVDCIAMVDADFDWDVAMADAARVRHDRRNARLSRPASRKPEDASCASTPDDARKRAIVEAAMARAAALRSRRSHAGPAGPR